MKKYQKRLLHYWLLPLRGQKYRLFTKRWKDCMKHVRAIRETGILVETILPREEHARWTRHLSTGWKRIINSNSPSPKTNRSQNFQYSRRSTVVLPMKYSSTFTGVLEYFFESTEITQKQLRIPLFTNIKSRIYTWKANQQIPTFDAPEEIQKNLIKEWIFVISSLQYYEVFVYLQPRNRIHGSILQNT